MKKIEEGHAAPNFSGKTQSGREVSLADFKGKKLIIFFYPQDNTPTCTTEACNLRDNYKLLKKQGFEVIGISADSERKHQNFIRKFHLPFDLIADTGRDIINAFGVWGKKTTFGITYNGILRTTFVIDESGKVIKRIDSVKAKSHAQQILEQLNIK